MASVSAEFSAWPDLDWRFLLPDPTLARVWLDEESDDERTALLAAGIAVSQGAADAGVAFVRGQAFVAPSLEESLPAGTLVRFAVAGRPSAGAARSLRPWTSQRKFLQARGWTVLGCFCATPGLRQARGYAGIGDATAVRRLLLMAHPRRGLRARLKLGAALVATRVGLGELACREGLIVARTPNRRQSSREVPAK